MNLKQNSLSESTTENSFCKVINENAGETIVSLQREVELEDGTTVTVEGVTPEAMKEILNFATSEEQVSFKTPGEKYVKDEIELNGVVQIVNEAAENAVSVEPISLSPHTGIHRNIISYKINSKPVKFNRRWIEYLKTLVFEDEALVPSRTDDEVCGIALKGFSGSHTVSLGFSPEYEAIAPTVVIHEEDENHQPIESVYIYISNDLEEAYVSLGGSSFLNNISGFAGDGWYQKTDIEDESGKTIFIKETNLENLNREFVLAEVFYVKANQTFEEALGSDLLIEANQSGEESFTIESEVLADLFTEITNSIEVIPT